MKKTIGIFSTQQGHQSIAEAIKQKIEKKAGNRYRVHIFYTKQPFSLIYNSIYRLAPKALDRPYEFSVNMIENYAELNELVSNFLLKSTYQESMRFIEEKNIDITIGAYLCFQPSLEKIQEEKNIPYFNVVANPRTIHPLELSPKAKMNFFFDKKNLTKYQKKCRAKAAGWFVSERFETQYQKEEIIKKLKIKTTFNFLIASGSEGSTAVLKILPALINCQKPLQVFVACGNNKTLYNNVLGIQKSLLTFSQSKATITPLKFTKKLDLYMKAADLIIGKAGPNTLFESVATLTPFFAVTHLAQEEGNLAIIKENNLGIVEENAKAANQEIAAIIKHPEQLEKFKPGLRKIKKYNQQSIDVLVKEIDRIFENNK
jgi:UDP-N-acetylglucosamine:LPS N-acetylglucosamine transferase